MTEVSFVHAPVVKGRDAMRATRRVPLDAQGEQRERVTWGDDAHITRLYTFICINVYIMYTCGAILISLLRESRAFMRITRQAKIRNARAC